MDSIHHQAEGFLPGDGGQGWQRLRQIGPASDPDPPFTQVLNLVAANQRLDVVGKEFFIHLVETLPAIFRGVDLPAEATSMARRGPFAGRHPPDKGQVGRMLR